MFDRLYSATGCKTVAGLSLLLALTTVLATAFTGRVSADSASTVYLNGDVVTMDIEGRTAEAVVIRDGRIVLVGAEAEVLARAGEGATVIDLKGRALLPGFIDAHGHFGGVAMYLAFENVAAPPVGAVANIADIQKILSAKKTSVAKGGWILGSGYDDAYLAEGRHPDRFDLDQVSTELAVALVHVSGHFLSCNSKCLEIAGIDAHTKDPEGGVIGRVAGSAQPNGVFEEQAMYKLLPFLPIHDVERFLGLVDRAQDYYAGFGITTVQDGASMPSDLQLFELAGEQGLLKLDLIAYPTYKALNLLNSQYPPSASYRNHWRIGGVKLSLDGSPQGKTAFLGKPYHIPPAGRGDDYLGYPTMQQSEVNRYIELFYAKGWQTLVHANGDAAAQQMIDAVALAGEKHGSKDRRTTMIHAQTVREDQLDQMQALEIVPSYFVSHTFFWGDWHRDSVLGKKRAARISPVKSSVDRSMPYTLHNDAPIVPPDILSLVWSAVNRVTRSGKVLGPEQRISVQDALRGVTINAAYQNFEENSKGSIEAGKLADLVILSENPLRVDPATIKDIQVLATIKEGQQIYPRKGDNTL